MAFDPSLMTIRELLAAYAAVLRELRDRGVVRTSNSPVGDYAEYLTASAMGLSLNTNSSSGCDAVGPDGIRYEIKSRRLATGSKANRFSAIRNLEASHFDVLVAVLFRDDFAVERAVCLPREAVERLSFWQRHVNGWILPVHESVWNDPAVTDITHLMRKTQETLGLAISAEGEASYERRPQLPGIAKPDLGEDQRMPSRNYFTPDEIMLCTYAAIYDSNDFGGVGRIERLTNRSSASIKMKIQNIAAMLDESGIERHNDVRALTGRPPGEAGRMTNWDQVEPLTLLKQPEFLAMCRAIAG